MLVLLLVIAPLSTHFEPEHDHEGNPFAFYPYPIENVRPARRPREDHYEHDY